MALIHNKNFVKRCLYSWNCNHYMSTSTIKRKIRNTDDKLRLIKLEHSYHLLNGHKVPNVLSEEMLNRLSKIDSAEERYDIMVENFCNNFNKSKDPKKIEFKEESKIFPRVILKRTYSNFFNLRLIQNFKLELPMIIDFSYLKHIPYTEVVILCKQITRLIAYNRLKQDSIPLYFKNYDYESFIHEYILKLLPDFDKVMVLTDCNQIPKKKQIFITSNCKDELTEFDHDAIYVIDALMNQTDHLRFVKHDKKIKKVKIPVSR